MHPGQPEPQFSWDALPPALELAPDLVGQVLRAFPADTAPGACGLRVQHLREAGQPGDQQSILAHLAEVVGLMAQGRVCGAAAPVLAGASLVAVPKPRGGVRPIAIGDVLRRLTGKCLMRLVRDEATTCALHRLESESYSGSEAAVHTVRAWLRRQASATDKVLVKLDFANAFNTVSRQAVLDAAVAHFPGLARWVAWCYGKASSLQFGSSTTLQSAGGVQQGDFLGPLLFAAALQPLASSLRAGQLDLSFFFLDDGVIAGDVAAVQQALQEVERRGATIGLRLNLAKCEVVGVGRLDASTLSNRLPPELLRTPDGASRLQWNFELLGAAVGDVAFSAVNTLERVDKAAPLLEALGELEDAQVALRLLRSCAGHCRMVHTARCCPSRGVMPALEKFDSLVKECFAGFTGLHLDAGQWEQAARGLPYAGLGILSMALDAPAAYLASVGGCVDKGRTIDPQYAAAGLAVEPEVIETTAALNRSALGLGHEAEGPHRLA